jgi:opacity protein-like surface antigen
MTRRNRQIFWPALVLGTVTFGVTSAAAQSRGQHRVEISANVGVQIGATEFTESHDSTFNGETKTITVDHGVKTALGYNLGGAVKIVPQFWVGVQYGMSDMKSSASITAVIPHPLLFNAPRTVEGSSDDVTHNEQNVHLDLMYALPFHAMDIRVMGGPTFFNVKQDLVSDVVINESYPFDTATFASATTKQLSKRAVGFNAGLDISRLITSQVGIGALIRYSRADVKFNDADVGTQTVRAGGTDVTAGVRFRF